MLGPDLPRIKDGRTVAAPSWVVERFEERFLREPGWKQISKEFASLDQAKYFESQTLLSNYVVPDSDSDSGSS